MTGVFLSYAREDAPTAQALAKALERAGYSVWWDRHIHGGAEYASAIEAALRSADAILVLWSHASVRSSWVRDEAAEGRESGRLVPILLDDCTPPLGFRQIQSISLAGWSRRGNPPHLQEIVRSLTARADKAGPQAPLRPAPRRPPQRLLLAGLAVIGALLVAIGAWWLLDGRSRASATPVLAVLPFTDLSPKRDKAFFAEGVAEAILTVLAKEPGIRVVGRSTAQQLQDAGAGAERMRRALGITHVLEGSARSSGDQLRISVRLLDSSDGQQLWAEEFDRRLNNVFAVQDEIGRAVAQRLKGSFASGGASPQQFTTVDAYTLYLAARAKMRHRQPQALREAFELAKQAVAADPNSGPAHAIYAEAVTLLADTAYGQIPAKEALQIASTYAQRAIKLAPNSAEGYAALGAAWAQIDGSRAIPPLQKAVQLDPSRAEAHLWLGLAQNDVGRNTDAERNYRLATDVDPLLGVSVWRLVAVYAASAAYERAEDVVNEYVRRGGSSAWENLLRGEIEKYRGSLARAAQFYRASVREEPQWRFPALQLASTYSDLGLYEPASRLVIQEKPLLQALMANRRDAHALARAAPEAIWYGDDLERATRYLAAAGDWPSIVKLYDMPTALHDRLCRFPFAAIDVAMALRSLSRSDAAANLIACAKRTIAVQQQGPYRTEFLPQGKLHMAKAQLNALDGKMEAAFREASRAADAGFRIPAGWGLSYFPAFDEFRTATEYRALDKRFRQLTLAERHKAMAETAR